MLGAIVGDIIGSRFERSNIKVKDFELFTPECTFTDDTIHTVALASSLMTGTPYELRLKEYYYLYPNAGYGGNFRKWALSDNLTPYNSFGNGSAMRVSPVGWFFDDQETVLDKALKSAAVTHNHPEGIKGAQAVASAIFLASQQKNKAEIKEFAAQRFGYDLNRSVDSIRPNYAFDVSCQGSVPEAIIAFLDSTDFEDAIRNAISIGGDSDTIACIAGSIAEAYYGGVPASIAKEAWRILDHRLRSVAEQFQQTLREKGAPR